MVVVMARSVPTKTGVREIRVDEKDVKALEAQGWVLKSVPSAEPQNERPFKKGKKRR